MEAPFLTMPPGPWIAPEKVLTRQWLLMSWHNYCGIGEIEVPVSP